jgi:hypothetical protein
MSDFLSWLLDVHSRLEKPAEEINMLFREWTSRSQLKKSDIEEVNLVGEDELTDKKRFHSDIAKEAEDLITISSLVLSDDGGLREVASGEKTQHDPV